MNTDPAQSIYDPADGYVYVATTGTGSVAVLSNGFVIGNITTGTTPMMGAYDALNQTVYVLNEGSDTVSVVSGLSVVGTITVTTAPTAAAWDPSDNEVYVGIDSGAGTVAVLNSTHIESTITTAEYPTGVLYDPDNNEVYVANGVAASISVICGATTCDGGTVDKNKVVTTITGFLVGSQAGGMALDPTNDYLYSLDDGHNGLLTINAATNAYSNHVGLPSPPNQIVYDAVTDYMYVACTCGVGPSDVSVFVPSSLNPAITNVGSGGATPTSVVVDSGNGNIYAANSGGDSVSVFASVELLGTIDLAGETTTDWVTYDSANGDLYVSDDGSATVSIISSALVQAPVTVTPHGMLLTTGTVGFTSTFWSNLTGVGTPPDSVIATERPAGLGCPGSPTFSIFGAIGGDYLPCTPSAAGTYSLWFNATDSDGSQTSQSLSFTVYSLPSVTVPTPNVGSADVGQSVVFSTTASGGSGVYAHYLWSESAVGLGCTITNAPSISCVPTTPFPIGYTVSVRVVDSGGRPSTVVASSAFDVYADPEITSPRTLVNGTISSSIADMGEALTISVAVLVGGSPGTPAFSWTGLPAGCASLTNVVSCPASTAGLYTISATYTDTDHFSTTNSSTNLTIAVDPVVGPIYAFLPSADVYESNEWWVYPSGGSDNYTNYTWSGLPPYPDCLDVYTEVPFCTFSPADVGTLGINVSVTDSTGWVATTPSGGFASIVYPDPQVTIPTVTVNGTSAALADEGQDLVFSTVLVSSGSGGITGFVWSGLPSGCSGSTASISCVASSAGTFSPSVSVTDSNSVQWISISSNLLTVNLALAVSAPTASVASADVGQPVAFYATAIGGTGPYSSYVWSGLPSSCSGTSTANPVCTLKAADVGTLHVSVQVTDALGWTAGALGSVSVVVHPDPTVSAPNANRTSADVGQSVEFLATAVGGSGGDVFTWSGLPTTGCSGTTTALVICTLGTAGTLSITVLVIDSDGVTSSVSPFLSFVVHGDPTVSTPGANRTSADVGQSVEFLASASGGSGGYLFSWTGLPGVGCSGTATATVDCSLTSTGTLTISVSIVDSNGVGSGASSTLTFIVDPDPSVSSPLPSLDSGGIDVGESATFSTTFTSTGSGNDVLSWSSSASGLDCAVGSTLEASCYASAAGNYTVSVQIRDSNGGEGSAVSETFEVLGDPTAPAPSPWFGTFDSGQTIHLQADPYGGAGGFTIQWWDLPPGCASQNSAALSCTPTEAGTFVVGYNATDANGLEVRSPATGEVVEAPLTASASYAPTAPTAGSPVAFSVKIGGGAPPWSVAWHFGDGSGGNGAGTVHTYASAGTYTVVLWVNDSAGSSVFLSLTVTVSASSKTTSVSPNGTGAVGFLQSSVPLWWLLLVVVALAIALVGVAFAARRRPPQQEGPESEENAPGAPTGGVRSFESASVPAQEAPKAPSPTPASPPPRTPTAPEEPEVWVEGEEDRSGGSSAAVNRASSVSVEAPPSSPEDYVEGPQNEG